MTAAAADLLPAGLAESAERVADFGHTRIVRDRALPAAYRRLTGGAAGVKP